MMRILDKWSICCRCLGCSPGGPPPRALVSVGRTGPVPPLSHHDSAHLWDGTPEKHMDLLQFLCALQGSVHAAHHRGDVSIVVGTCARLVKPLCHSAQ